MSKAKAAVCGCGVPWEAVQAFASRHDLESLGGSTAGGFSDVDTAALPNDVAIVSLADNPDECNLCRTLEPPFAGCYEYLGEDDGLGRHQRDALAKGGLFVSLGTATSFRSAPAAAICKGLEARSLFSDEMLEGVETALQEAVANAIIHGNLELGLLPRSTPQDFMEYSKVMEERLGDPTFANRRIEVSATWSDTRLEIAVHDGGDGYDPLALRVLGDPSKKSGRGLQIIDSLTSSYSIGEGGRSIKLVFPVS